MFGSKVLLLLVVKHLTIAWVKLPSSRYRSTLEVSSWSLYLVSTYQQSIGNMRLDVPNENGIKRSDLPVLIRQKRDVKLQPFVLPQIFPPNLARVSHIA